MLVNNSLLIQSVNYCSPRRAYMKKKLAPILNMAILILFNMPLNFHMRPLKRYVSETVNVSAPLEDG